MVFIKTCPIRLVYTGRRVGAGRVRLFTLWRPEMRGLGGCQSVRQRVTEEGKGEVKSE